MNKDRAHWVVLLSAAIGMYVAGSGLVGQTARLVDVAALSGASVLFGVTLLQSLRRGTHE